MEATNNTHSAAKDSPHIIEVMRLQPTRWAHTTGHTEGQCRIRRGRRNYMYCGCDTGHGRACCCTLRRVRTSTSSAAPHNGSDPGSTVEEDDEQGQLSCQCLCGDEPCTRQCVTEETL